MIVDPDFAVPLPDGTRLSAKLWLPDRAKTEPVPAILEYIPYRKTDGTAARDHGMHLHFAKAGYACLRVDRRGCGESEGLFDDEYSEQELQDGVDIIAWIAEQGWCTGAVGMQGISWGGFNSVQIAARAPAALKAVISIGTTADRYHDDIHYKGGIQLTENVGWAATIMSWLSTPPDPALVGHNRWRGIWLNRLEKTPFLALPWMRHSDRDAYWEHGSICEDYEAIQIPVLVMGGLHDGYRNAMAAMVAGMPERARGVLGPWSHKYPNISTIGPSIDYLGEATRWWDRWLKGAETGADDGPAYRAYVMESCKPDVSLDYRAGEWLAFNAFPPKQTRVERLPLGAGVLGREEAFSAELETDLSCGRGCGEFFPFGFGPGELPDDQRGDDDLSLCFDGAVTKHDRVLVGAPRVRLRVAADGPRAQIIVRLCDLRPDGSSALISLGMLNLRHRDGFEAKRELEPGEVYEVDLALDQVAYRLPRGHRLRLALSGSYWPFCWPEGEAVTLTLSGGALELPVVEGGAPCGFDPPAPMEARPSRQLREGSERKMWSVMDGCMVLEIEGDQGRQEDLENGIVTESAVSERWSIMLNDPASAEAHIVWTRGFGRGDWMVTTRVETRMRGLKNHFDVEQSLIAAEGDEVLFSRTWREMIAR